MGGLESSQHSSQAACLELLLTFMQHMARRSEGVGAQFQYFAP
jgi:hypothetical protein